MDRPLQSASTTVGQQRKPQLGEDVEVTQWEAMLGSNPHQAVRGSLERIATQGLASFKQGPPPPGTNRHSSVDSYSESNSTASSSSVDSSGCNSPVSTSTATSNFYFFLEDQGEVALDDDGHSQLIRSFGSSLHKDIRGRPHATRHGSLGSDKVMSSRSSSVGLLSQHLLPEREKTPGQLPHYTFPLRSASGWSASSIPAHSASAPASASESRRGSTHSGRPRPLSSLSITSSVDGDSKTKLEDSLHHSSGTIVTEPQMKTAGMEDEPMDGTRVNISEYDAVSTIDDHSESSPQPPDPKRVEEICEQVLKQAFSVDLDDLDFPSDALESVTYCLEELSHIVSSCRPVSNTGPSREAPSGDPRSRASEDWYPPDQRSRGKKRASNRDNRNEKTPGDDEEQNTQSGDDSDSPASSKKVKVEPPDNRYTCPYRKRNPLKFNVRDYNTCATTPFSDFTNLKRHIKLYHTRQSRRLNICIRCGVDQGTPGCLLAHSQLPPERMCAVRREAQDIDPDTDPEEGITRDVVDLLNERKSKAKIDTWPSLWRALFGGGDDVLPSEFVPPVEWDEVRAEFEATREILKNRVHLESVTIKELRPEAQAYVAAHMDQTCWDYVHSVLSACRLQADYSHQSERHHHHKRRRSQKLTVAGTGHQQNSSPGQQHGCLLPPLSAQQRHILPKPPVEGGDGIDISPNAAVIHSNGSSLSSSWETAISNISSSNLQSTSSSTSLMTTPGEAMFPPSAVADPSRSFVYLPVPDIPPPDGSPAYFVTGNGEGETGCQTSKSDSPWHGFGSSVGEIPPFVQTHAEGGEFGLEGLFGYADGYDADEGAYDVYEADGAQFHLGDHVSGHMLP